MASLKLNHIYKVYPNGAKAVSDFCMDIEDKEFIVFVGPSGCGKSTTLRMIAGLEEITAGELSIDGEVVNDVEPKNRDIAMVFQNYALYPHMTVYENMAFGLKLRRVADIMKDRYGNAVLDKFGEPVRIMRHLTRAEIDEKVHSAAEILGITEYLKRKPAAMSGGQRQRVALGRAIVREPKVFLLDEPLSNLDAKLRTQMRSEISKLHSKIQTTFIYVTHDQVEAMTMGTRIVVMKDGFVQQIDTPRNLYSYPVNKFVAGFIGTPQMNFYSGKLKAEGESVRVTFDNTDLDVLVPREYFAKADARYFDGQTPVTFGIRLEHVSVDPEQYPYRAKCRVSYVEDLGMDGQVYADLNIDSLDTITESPTKLIIKSPVGTFYRSGEVIDISLDLSKLHVFDAVTEKTIMPRIPEITYINGEVKGNKLTIFGTQLRLPPAVRPADGEYGIVVPTSALSLGGDISADYVGDEHIDGKRLVRMNVGNLPVFLLAEDGADIGRGLAVDIKQISYIKDGEESVSALPRENMIEGRLVKNKVKDEVDDGKGGKKKEKFLAFTFELAGKFFDCPDDMAEKIINGAGLSVFKKSLGIKFSPDDVHICDDGIAVTVEKVLDYGDGKYAECSYEISRPLPKKKFKPQEYEKVVQKVYVAVGADFNGHELCIAPDVHKCGVYELDRDIRLV